MKTIGTVKWFNDAKGYGSISLEGEPRDIFVHYTAIITDGFKTLNEGQPVEFELVEGSKGLQAQFVCKKYQKETSWAKYANSFNVSLAQAIADRDEPMTKADCIEAFVASCGREPTTLDLEIMRPDSEETVAEQIRYYSE